MKYRFLASIFSSLLLVTFAHSASATGNDAYGVRGFPLSIHKDNDYIETDLYLMLPSILISVDQKNEEIPIEKFAAIAQHKKLIDAINAGDAEAIALLATHRNDELFKVYIKRHQGKFVENRSITGVTIGNRTIFFEKIPTKSKSSVRYFVYKLIGSQWKWEFEKNDPMINIIAESLEHSAPVDVNVQTGLSGSTSLPLIVSKASVVHWLTDDLSARESANGLLTSAQVALDAQNYEAIYGLYTNESGKKIADLVKAANASGETYRITDILNFRQHKDANFISMPPFILESVKTEKGRQIIRYYIKTQDGSLKFTNFFYSGFMDDFLLKYDYSSPDITLANFVAQYVR